MSALLAIVAAAAWGAIFDWAGVLGVAVGCATWELAGRLDGEA